MRFAPSDSIMPAMQTVPDKRAGGAGAGAGLLLSAALLLAVTSGAATGAVAAPAASAPKVAAGADTLPVARMNVPQAILAASRGEVLLVDVRPAGQRSLGHIKNDVHAPFDRMAAGQAELPKGKRLLFYCSCHAEEVALDAARLLQKKGNADVAVLVGGYDDWKQAGGPIEIDATWEETFKVDAPPVGWGKTPVDPKRCRYEVDRATAARGAASARITCVRDTSARGFAGYTQKLDPAGLRGRKLTLSAMVRTQDAAPGAFLWIGAEDAQGRVMGMTRPDANPIVGTQDWHVVEVSGVVPPTAVKVLVGVSLMASGTVWLDDVRLVADEDRGMPRLRVVVANQSFEE